MMTGYGHNSNLVQQPSVHQGVDGQWAQHVDQSQYFPGNGATGLTNPLFYGSMSEWYPTPCYETGVNGQTDQLGCQQQQETHGAMEPTVSVNHPFHKLHTNLAPPPQPRVSISDEELYQALNMSPITTISATNAGYLQSHLQQHPPLPPTDYLSTDVCYQSTPSYESSGYHDHGYIPATSTIPPEDPHHHHHGHDGDDEESFGVPERYETVSPTFSIHSFAPTTSTNTAEADTADLEVELINHFKPNPVYQAPDELDIFLHTGTTDDTEYNDNDDSRPTTTFSHRSPKAPTPPASRPAYAKKLTAAAQQKKPEPTLNLPDISAPLFLQTSVPPPPPGFTPLLTPNSDALLQKKLNEVVHHQPPRLHGLHPAFPSQRETSFTPRVSSSYLDLEAPFQDNYAGYRTESAEGYYPSTPLNNIYDFSHPDQDLLPHLLDSFQPLPPPEYSNRFNAPPAFIPELLTSPQTVQVPGVASATVKAPRLSDQELESESQKLAIDVISNLFTTKKEIIDRAAEINAPKKPVARNLFCHDEDSLKKLKSEEIVKMNVLDDWETADDEDLTGRMENLLKDVKKAEKKKPQKDIIPTSVTSPQKTSDWDPTFLQHVVEIYGVPDYAMQEDVVKAMETIGYGDSKVVWVERKAVFAAFENVARAKNCLTLAKHDWLRFRSIANAPKVTQDFAKSNASSLSIPKKKQQTTATVARRMVEHALGKKATVTAEKRQEERSQLAAARAAKKNVIHWD